MAASLPMNLTKDSQSKVLQLLKQCVESTGLQYNLRTQMETVDRLYQREKDLTIEHNRAKQANNLGDSTKFQNITVPVVMPAVESAVTYQASVFLTGVPIFGCTAAPEFIDQALQLETVIDEQATKGAWVREFMLMFRDGFKYNLAAIEVPWVRNITAALDTDMSFSATEAKQTEVIWEGNAVKRLDMYNTFFDPRVAPVDVYKYGEWAGYTEFMSRTKLMSFINSLPLVLKENLKAAYESGMGAGGTFGGATGAYYIPQINPDAMLDKKLSTGTDWNAWAGLSTATPRPIQYKSGYEVTTTYVRIVPSEYGIKAPAADIPQVWKFISVNNQVIIYAERQTNAHGYIPILFCQPQEDGLELQTKSLAQNVAPIQSITSALANSGIASRRRAISDRTLYDPSRIDAKHINNENPSAKIPVKPAAYGKNLSEAVYQFPFRDDQAQLITQEINQYRAMGNEITGQNPVRQGQFVKGNKTRKEFSDVMANANGRDQLVSILLEAQIFTPLKEILKINVLQYQGGVSLYSRSTGDTVKVDPVELRKSVMQFKISDGLTPADKLMDTDVSMVAMQQIGSSPALQGEYNIGPMFSYLMKLQGAHISAFEKSPQQKSYEQAVATWQQTVTQIYQANKEVDPKTLPVQPKPADYGYEPQQQAAPDNGTAGVAGSAAQSQTGAQ